MHFTPDHKGLGELLRGPAMRDMLMDRARGGAQFAQRIAPVDTGAYRDSIQAVDSGLGGHRRDRATAEIVATAEHAAAVEWGNAHQPHPCHVLARTVDVVERG